MTEMNVGFSVTFYILFDVNQVINSSHLLYPTWEDHIFFFEKEKNIACGKTFHTTPVHALIKVQVI